MIITGRNTHGYPTASDGGDPMRAERDRDRSDAEAQADTAIADRLAVRRAARLTRDIMADGAKCPQLRGRTT